MDNIKQNAKHILLGILCYLSDQSKPDTPIVQQDIVDFLNDTFCWDVGYKRISADLDIISTFHKYIKEKLGFNIEGRLIQTTKDSVHKNYEYKRSLSYEQISALLTLLQSSLFFDESTSKAITQGFESLADYEFNIDTDKDIRSKMLNKEIMRNIGIINQAIKENKKVFYYNGGINRYQQLHYSKIVDEEYVLDTVFKSNDKNEIIAETYEYDYNPDTSAYFKPVTVSPYSIVWDNSRCYMICRPDGKEFTLRCVRVDRMFETEIIEDKKIEVPPITSRFYSKTAPKHFNTQKFIRSAFNMFPCPEKDITEAIFHVNRKFVKVMTERFGFDIAQKSLDENDEYFEYRILIQPSKAFFGWLFSFDTKDIKLTAPQNLVDKYKEFLRDRLRDYNYIEYANPQNSIKNNHNSKK